MDRFNPRSHARQPGRDQEAFVIDVPQPVVVEPTVLPQPTTPEGAFVSFEDRAQHLGQALKALNTANSRAGFHAAAASPRRIELEQRYGSDGVEKRLGSTAVTERLEYNRAKREFAQATGETALVTSGLMSGADAARVTAREFGAFTAKYGVGVTTARVRNAYAQKLTKNAQQIAKGRRQVAS